MRWSDLYGVWGYMEFKSRHDKTGLQKVESFWDKMSRGRNEDLKRVCEDRQVLTVFRKRKLNWLEQWMRTERMLMDAMEWLVNRRRRKGWYHYDKLEVWENGKDNRKQDSVKSCYVENIINRLFIKYLQIRNHDLDFKILYEYFTCN